MEHKFAVFDIDGTLVRWQLYHAIGDGLAKAGVISEQEFEPVKDSRMNWKTRRNFDSFKQYERELVSVIDEAIKGLDVVVFEAILSDVFNKYKEQVYTYTRDLITELKEANYLLFAISGSPTQIVGMVADYYGFDDYEGTSYKIKDSRFSGEVNLSLGKKGQLLDALIKKHKATREGSVGVGDSEGDIDMLSKVETAVAFNPTMQLFKKAKEENWKVVVERKNMVFVLNPGRGGYALEVS